ncbi:urease subunit beta [Pseudomonas helleri]|uniref:urease subunit beta n=1 Tax=Pseudomonas helleri TaxID=1608996 RepID=UPI00225DE3A5|nr:urease subunit beta [Pseudomonas helleri]
MTRKKTAAPASPHQETHPEHSIPNAKDPGGVPKGQVDDVPLGGIVYASTPITFNEDRPVTQIKVRNTGDRPIQIGSHYHFFEVNRALEFDRAAAFGKRLNITSTTAIRFEPGDEIEVSLIPYGGK